jgi:2,4-dienoyl-CoA reductase-like NADH-dependent reductase (Old Yellow Enzyme family)
MDVRPLFRPLNVNGLTLPNRIVMAPMTRRFSPDGVPDAQVADYYRRRAEGGVGLILTEGTTIGRPAASNHASIPNFHAPASLAGWAQVVSAVHAAGGLIAPQLWHQGSTREPLSGPHPQAPSEGPSALNEQSQAMSDADVADTIEAFATAAAAAQRIGFDAVELHGAHGYLIDQFLWGKSNVRSDRYGGDAVERTRFAVEVVRAVRRAVGPTFPVSFRFSQWKVQDYHARLAETPAALERLLVPLAEAGVDIFHASTRRFWEPEFDGSSLNLAGWSRKLTGRAVISVGSVGLEGADFMEQLRGDSTGAAVGSLDELLRRMDADEFDLIAVGRALLSDPQWPIKVRQGRLDELRPFEKRLLAALN